MAIGDDDLDRIRAMWRSLCVAPHAFAGVGVAVVAVDDTRAAPPGWTAIVRIVDATVVAGPDAARVAASFPGDLTDPDVAAAAFGGLDRTLGPALLSYGRPDTPARHRVVGPLPSDDPLVRELLADASQDEVDESGLDSVPSGTWVAVDASGSPGAGCGWHVWPGDVAHIGVLTAASQRRRGFAASAAAVAMRAASDARLLPQWRAAVWNDASIALAARLGLICVGSQLSVLPAPVQPGGS